MLLTSIAAVAVATVIRQSLDLPARIKWPNDVRIAGKKCCGILVEVLARRRRPNSTTPNTTNSSSAHRRENPRFRAAIIGIGINVNLAAHELPANFDAPATSLQEMCGQSIDRSDLVRSLIRMLDQLYHRALSGRMDEIWDRWRELADLIGKSVRVEHTQGTLHGRLMDLRAEQCVRIRTRNGELVELPITSVLSIKDSPPRGVAIRHSGATRKR